MSKSKNPKDAGVLVFRISAAERAAIEAAAEIHDVSPSVYARRLVFAGTALPAPKERRSPSQLAAEIARSNALLGRMASSAHQIAKRVNFGQPLENIGISVLINEIKSLKREVSKLTQ